MIRYDASPTASRRLNSRRLLLILIGAALALMISGCFRRHHPPPRGPKRCPPGHVWKDGNCHPKGKGHDPKKPHGPPRR